MKAKLKQGPYRQGARHGRPKTHKTIKFILFGVLGLCGMINLWLFKSIFFSGPDYGQVQAVANQYADYYLENQSSIVAQVQAQEIWRLEDVGHLFIPEDPWTYPDIQNQVQLPVPYLNQNDPQWRHLSYGTDGSQQFWENGCAIAVLAMVEAYYSGTSPNPKAILQWAGNDFYLDQQGTSWSIFSAFGDQYGYQVEDLAKQIDQVKAALNQGQVVLVSVGPGAFTQVGHVMLIRGYQDGYFYLNDPNDSPGKFFSIQGIEEDVLARDALNFWALSPH